MTLKESDHRLRESYGPGSVGLRRKRRLAIQSGSGRSAATAPWPGGALPHASNPIGSGTVPRSSWIGLIFTLAQQDGTEWNGKRRPRVTSYFVATVFSVGVGIALPMVTETLRRTERALDSHSFPRFSSGAWYGSLCPRLSLPQVSLVFLTSPWRTFLFTAGSSSPARAFGGSLLAWSPGARGVSGHFVRCRRRRRPPLRCCGGGSAVRESESTVAERDRLEAIVRDLPVGVVIAFPG